MVSRESWRTELAHEERGKVDDNGSHQRHDNKGVWGKMASRRKKKKDTGGIKEEVTNVYLVLVMICLWGCIITYPPSLCSSANDSFAKEIARLIAIKIPPDILYYYFFCLHFIMRNEASSTGPLALSYT